MRFLAATQIFDGKQFLPKGKLLVLSEDNTLLNCVNASETEAANVETYDGIICPGFVNAHCHLELSYLKGQIPEKTGLVGFAKGIITKRMAFSEEVMKHAAAEADTIMRENGIVAVGDISNAPVSFGIKQNSPVYYHTFIELIGLNPQHANVVFTFGKDLLSALNAAGLTGSLTPHAPYSVSFELMKEIAALAEGLNVPLSIHNQESAEEDKFFMEKKGGFAELYDFLKLPTDYFQPTGLSSLRSYLRYLSNNQNLLLVHDTFTPPQDLIWANSSNPQLFWCLCPNANLYIENTLPNIQQMLDANCRLCIGTDSLASNHQLSVVSEMNVLLRAFPFIEPEQLLSWATSNGAKALGIADRFGSLINGKNAGLSLLLLQDGQFTFRKKLA
ncbi:MAG: amidohydrolase family protein [Bacteroidia bacterium]